MRDHLLTSYQAALASILGAQFSSKRFATGREGVLSLARRKGECCGLLVAILEAAEVVSCCFCSYPCSAAAAAKSFVRALAAASLGRSIRIYACSVLSS